MKKRIFILSYFIFVLCGCVGTRPQKGGSAHLGSSAIAQSENPGSASRLDQHRNYERTFTIPQGSVIFLETDSGIATNTPTRAPAIASRVVLSQPMLVQEKEVTGAVAELGSAQKDEARSLGARFAAMRPVQWVGIALCVASIAAFYFGWPSLGLMAIAVGAGMILTAAVVPGHETLILSVGGIGLGILALVMGYAYHKGKLDANHNGIPDFLEKRDASPK